MKRYFIIFFLACTAYPALCQDTENRRGTFNICARQKLVICSDEKERDTITIAELVKDPILIVDSCKDCRVTSFSFIDVTDASMRSRTVLGEHFPKDFIKALLHKPSAKPISIQNVFYTSNEEAGIQAMHGIPIFVK